MKVYILKEDELATLEAILELKFNLLREDEKNEAHKQTIDRVKKAVAYTLQGWLERVRRDY